MTRRQLLWGTGLAVTAATMTKVSAGPWAAMGQVPQGNDKKRILASPQYRDQAFQNMEPTPMMAPETDYWKLLSQYANPQNGQNPAKTIPVAQPDHTLRPALGDPVFTWLGHSSYILRWTDLTLVVDPVLNRASPVGWAGPKAYSGMDAFGLQHLPGHIDVLLITHDHYDHLDYQTVVALQSRVSRIVTPIGVGAHLRYWGIDPAKITELDWWESAALGMDTVLTASPARHFSGRGFIRNQSLWASFVLNHQGKQIYLGGDSGYGQHFSLIQERLGSFDLAILECGQYHNYWRHIHMLASMVPQAAKDLGAKQFIPVHWGKFTLSLHPWFEPPTMAKAQAATLGIPILLPKPGLSQAISTMDDEVWWQSLL